MKILVTEAQYENLINGDKITNINKILNTINKTNIEYINILDNKIFNSNIPNYCNKYNSETQNLLDINKLTDSLYWY